MNQIAEVLEGLRADEHRLSGELAGVRRAIAALEAALGTGPAQAPESPQGSPAERSTAPPTAGTPAPADTSGPYATSGFYEAVADYLASEGEPRTAREIAEALLAGGYPTRAKNFTATVRTMLHRDLSMEPFGIETSETDSRWFVRE